MQEKMEIFRTDMSAFAPEACLPFLCEEERLRAERLTGSVRRRYVVSRSFRRRILGAEAEILLEENGRPYIKGNPVFFSMSHTGDALVMVVDAHPIGVDIELLKTRDFARLSSWFFGERIPGRDDFYRRWTSFEAGLKLAGLTLLSKAVPEPEYLHSEILGDCMLSVASNHGISLPLSITTVRPEATEGRRTPAPGSVSGKRPGNGETGQTEGASQRHNHWGSRGAVHSQPRTRKYLNVVDFYKNGVTCTVEVEELFYDNFLGSF